MEDIVAVIFLDEHSAAEPQADGPGYADRAKGLVRKIQK
jgi:hypothetical protein